MKHIKKFSQLVTESTGRAAEIQEVVKKLGYNSLEEIKQERALLTKLEGLMKALSTAGDVSEDEAEEIEDKMVAKGAPKSLVGKMGKKEEDGEPGAEEGVEEDAAEEIEDKKVKRGKPEGHSEEEGEEVVTRDQEITDTVPGEEDDETQGTKVPKARIMTFEEFIRENEVTINKKVSYQDDEEEDEDNALPVAEADEHGIHVPLAMGDGDATATSIAKKVVTLGEPEEHEEEEGEVVVTRDQEVTQDPEESEDETDTHATVVVEAKVDSEKDFEDYAMSVLKKAHPEDFDQEIADKVVADLKAKYKGDFGAMVGALTSGLNENEESFEFGFEDRNNFDKATNAVKSKGIKFDTTTGGGIHYLVFNSEKDLNRAVKIVDPLIDKSTESEWD